jgi:uncharacterized protein YbbC (DUF1343 family)
MQFIQCEWAGNQSDWNRCARRPHGRRVGACAWSETGSDFQPGAWIAGKLDTTAIGNSRTATGVPIYSVYGDTDAKRRPTIDALGGLDEIVFDIQDIGVRFYTYESTLGYFLEAAAKSGKEIVVLDRPNPIGGAYVQGPVADSGRESFVVIGRLRCGTA